MDTRPEGADNNDDLHPADVADAEDLIDAGEGVDAEDLVGTEELADAEESADAEELVSSDDVDSDVVGTQSKVTKARVDNPDASVFDREGGVNTGVALGVVAIVAIAVIAAFFITRSANNTDLKLVQGSVQESLTPDCFWSIIFELENTTDNPIAVFDTKVARGNNDLIVTQAARDLVVQPNATAQNVITYYVDNCPGDTGSIDHGSLDILNTTLGGTQQTTRLDF